MRFVAFIAEWEGDRAPTQDEVERLTFGARDGPLIHTMLGMSTMVLDGVVRLCIHIHPAREEELVREALVRAFDLDGLAVSGVKVGMDLRNGVGLRNSVVGLQKLQFLLLEFGYMASEPWSFTYQRDERTIFGDVKPMPMPLEY